MNKVVLWLIGFVIYDEVHVWNFTARLVFVEATDLILARLL